MDTTSKENNFHLNPTSLSRTMQFPGGEASNPMQQMIPPNLFPMPNPMNFPQMPPQFPQQLFLTFPPGFPPLMDPHGMPPLGYPQHDLLGHAMLRRRRCRTVFTPDQIQVLEDGFQQHKYPTTKFRKQIADKTGLPEERVQVWFQNRRAKEKRVVEEKLLLQKQEEALARVAAGKSKRSPSESNLSYPSEKMMKLRQYHEVSKPVEDVGLVMNDKELSGMGRSKCFSPSTSDSDLSFAHALLAAQEQQEACEQIMPELDVDVEHELLQAAAGSNDCGLRGYIDQLQHMEGSAINKCSW